MKFINQLFVLFALINLHTLQAMYNQLEVKQPVINRAGLDAAITRKAPHSQQVSFGLAMNKLSFLDDPKRQARGLELLNDLASDQNPLVLAQYQLGEREQSRGSLDNAKMYLQMAANNGYPPARRSLGELLLNQQKVSAGLENLQKAVGPKEMPGLGEKSDKTHYYYDVPAIGTLANWYFKEGNIDDSFHFTRLACMLTQDLRWYYQMQALQRLIVERQLAQTPVYFIPVMALPSVIPAQQQQQPEKKSKNEEDSDDELSDELLTARQCIEGLEAGAGESALADNNPFWLRLKELVGTDDEALMYILTKYIESNHGETLDQTYIVKLLHQLSERKLDESLYLRAKACLEQVPSTNCLFADAQWCLFNCYVGSNQLDAALALAKQFVASVGTDDCKQTSNNIRGALELLEAKFVGNKDVAYFLAKVFAEGLSDIIEINIKKSDDLFTKAAQAGHIDALIKCGTPQQCIDALDQRTSEMTPAQTRAVLARLRELVDADNQALIYILTTYVNGDHGVVKDPDYIVQLLQKVEDRQLLPKFFDLDISDTLLKQTDNIQLNYKLGQLFYTNAQASAQKSGLFYHKAIPFLNKVNQGDLFADAQWCLFNCYVGSNQLDVALALAKQFVASVGTDDCKQTSNNIRRALRLLEAKFVGNKDVAYFLAKIFAEGLSDIIEINTKKSEVLFTKAAKFGHLDALIRCGQLAMQRKKFAQSFKYFKQLPENISIKYMKQLAASGSIHSSVFLFDKLKHDNLPAALSYLAEPIILMTRFLFDENITIGAHRTTEEMGAYRSVREMNKVFSVVVSNDIDHELERIAKSVIAPDLNSPELIIFNKVNEILACINLLRVAPLLLDDAKKQEAIVILEKAHKLLCQCDEQKHNILLVRIEEMLGNFLNKSDTEKAKNYFAKAMNRGSIKAGGHLLCLLVDEHEKGRDCKTQLLKLSNDIVKVSPEWTLSVYAALAPKVNATSLSNIDDQLQGLLQKAGDNGCISAYLVLQRDNKAVQLPSAEKIEAELSWLLKNNDTQALFKVGAHYYLEGNFDKASEFLNRAALKNYPLAQFYLGLLCEKTQNDPLEYFKTFLMNTLINKSIEIDYLVVMVQRKLWDNYLEKHPELFSFLADYYSKVNVQNPDCVKLLFQDIGLFNFVELFFSDTKKYGEHLSLCVEFLKKMASINEGCACYLPTMLFSMYKKKIFSVDRKSEREQLEEIKRYFDNAKKIAPYSMKDKLFKERFVDCLVALGICCDSERRYKDAISFFNQALEVEPSNNCALRLADIYFNNKGGLSIKKTCQKAMQILHKSADAHSNVSAAIKLANIYANGIISLATKIVLVKRSPKKVEHYSSLIKIQESTQLSGSGIVNLTTPDCFYRSESDYDRDLLEKFIKLKIALQEKSVEEQFEQLRETLKDRRFGAHQWIKHLQFIQHFSPNPINFQQMLIDRFAQVTDVEKRIDYAYDLAQFFYGQKNCAVECSLTAAREYLDLAFQSRDQDRKVSVLSVCALIVCNDFHLIEDQGKSTIINYGLNVMYNALCLANGKNDIHYLEDACRQWKQVIKGDFCRENRLSLTKDLDLLREKLKERKTAFNVIEQNKNFRELFEQIVPCLKEGKNYFAFTCLKQNLEGGFLQNREGAALFLATWRKHQLITLLEKAYDDSKDQTYKKLFSYCLGLMHIEILTSPHFTEKNRENRRKKAIYYLTQINFEQSKELSRIIDNLLFIVESDKFCDKENEQKDLLLLERLKEKMIIILKNASGEKIVPFLLEAMASFLKCKDAIADEQSIIKQQFDAILISPEWLEHDEVQRSVKKKLGSASAAAAAAWAQDTAEKPSE